MLYNKTQWREALEKGASVYYFYSSDPFLARTAAETAPPPAWKRW